MIATEEIKGHILRMELKPNDVLFFDRKAVNMHALAELDFDIDFAVPCFPVAVPSGKTVDDCFRTIHDSELEKVTRQRDSLLAILELLKRGDCWCEMATGNPMLTSHSAACTCAQMRVKADNA